MTHRVQRVQELIRRELGPLLDKHFHFPGCIATIHGVSLTPDLKQCFVYMGILGKTDEPANIIKRLNDGRGLIQRDLYKRVRLKNSPSLVFRYDDSVERGVRVVNLIGDLPEPLPDEIIPSDEVAENLEEEEEVVEDFQEEEPPRRRRR
jgi:ribosome-binding factor A